LAGRPPPANFAHWPVSESGPSAAVPLACKRCPLGDAMVFRYWDIHAMEGFMSQIPTIQAVGFWSSQAILRGMQMSLQMLDGNPTFRHHLMHRRPGVVNVSQPPASSVTRSVYSCPAPKTEILGELVADFENKIRRHICERLCSTVQPAVPFPKTQSHICVY
jgi:hypothetical protein